MHVPSNAAWPKLVKKPRGRNIVVLAPHIDDEIIGCGGTLCKHIDSGDRVSVIYMTDGSRGTKDFAADTALCRQRRAEAAASNQILGISSSFFLDLQDGSEKSWDEAAPRLAELLGQLSPQLIYLPPYDDLHADHRKTNTLLRLAVPEYTGNLCVYEVWTPIQPNLLVNITPQMERKLSAIRACGSQIAAVPYDRMILGLNTYRAAFLFAAQAEYAEAFRLLPAQEYWQEF
ncbi:MAG: PIG-L deacetylase family protein [Faecousia sp.]